MPSLIEQAYNAATHAWTIAGAAARSYWKGYAIVYESTGPGTDMGIRFFVNLPILPFSIGAEIDLLVPGFGAFGVHADLVQVNSFVPMNGPPPPPAGGSWMKSGDAISGQVRLAGGKYTTIGGGTLGAFMSGSDGSIWGLSANHVIARNNDVGLQVFHSTLQIISEEVHPVMVTPTGNTADVAAAKLGTRPDFTRPDLTNPAVFEVTPANMSALSGKSVSWYGSTHLGTKRTAKLRSPKSSLTLDLSFSGLNSADFKDQFLIDNSSGFAQPGDSGSMVTLDGQPFGILIAIEEVSRTAVISPLSLAVKSLAEIPAVGRLVVAR